MLHANSCKFAGKPLSMTLADRWPFPAVCLSSMLHLHHEYGAAVVHHEGSHEGQQLGPPCLHMLQPCRVTRAQLHTAASLDLQCGVRVVSLWHFTWSKLLQLVAGLAADGQQDASGMDKLDTAANVSQGQRSISKSESSG